MDVLEQFDVGWLRALELLLETASVSEAARRAHLGQPAMSRMLARMRVVLSDPILVRTGRGSELSANALVLRPRVQAALATLRDALRTPAAFDARGDPFEVRIAANDYAIAALLGPWFASVRKQAPRLSMQVAPIALRSIAALDAGELDFAVGPRLDTPNLQLDHFVVRPLWEDHFVCMMRKGHPSSKKRWSLETYLQYDHVLVATGRPGPAQMDAALAKLQKRRRVATTVPSFLLVPELLAQTDMIALLPKRLLAQRDPRLMQRALPLKLSTLPLYLAWHPRSTVDARHRWARLSLLAYAQALQPSA